MPSSITLTVSHLPTSTSFFLSALQPLDYAYRGRSNNTIGFGSTTNPSAPTDFWITQEVPGIPAGAAHVAFQAPSRTAVQHFFTAALKAGGNIHGEPAVRDNSGYYSAAIIDFDGNSIEAVFRPDFSDDKENDVRSTVSSKAITKVATDVKSQVSRAPASEAKSSLSRSAPPTEAPTPFRRTSGDMIDGIVSAANVARNLVQSVTASQPSPPRPSGDGDKNAIFGTLLGVAAGAALHYAFTHDKESTSRPPNTRSVTQPSHYQPHVQPQIEGPQYIALEDNDYASTIRPARSTTSSRHITNGGQIVYSTPFGNGSIAPSTTSKATRLTSGPKMIEAPPSSFKPPAPPSHLSRSSSHHTKRPSTSLSQASRPSTARHSSERSNAKPPPPTASTTTSRTHHILRTTSESQIHHSSSSYPPPSAASRTPTVTPASRPAPLSEANLARATTAPALPITSMSLHSRNREDEAYPIAHDSKSHSKGGKRSSTVGGSKHGSGKAARSGSTTSRKIELEVMPEDSISQVSSVRSTRSASTVKARSRR
jgi:hypothetical protein